MAENETKNTEGSQYSRREFILGVGGIGAGALLGGFLVKGFLLPDEVFAMPASGGYLLVDTKKCAGCSTCMLACSLVHSGENNLSLSRIQIVNDVFVAYPGGVEQKQCRQCPYPACVDACPTGANHVDAANGNVRTIDERKCIGCERCVMACPFETSRVQFNTKERHAQKCDLCANTPFWSEEGGVGGKQACVETCPMHAISFTTETPVQSPTGYMVNLRKDSANWKTFSLPDLDNGEYSVVPGAAGIVAG